MNVPTDAVLVGISPDGYSAALAFAVAEARRTQRPLHLVHIVPARSGEAYVGVYGGMLDLAKATLEDAVAEAEKLAGDDVTVTSELVDHGWVEDDLARHTDGASLLVLQHRALGRILRVFTGSVVQSVSSRAHVPVVSVPEGWTADESAKGVITAAAQDAVEAPAILRAGFEEAAARGARLDVLHAWWLSSGYDVAVVDEATRDEYSEQFRRELQKVLAPLGEEFPDVDVKVLVQHAPPVEAVLDHAELSDLLVLGRRHHLLPVGSHLGPVARSSLGHATCPVLITPEPAAPAAEPQYSDLLATIGPRPAAGGSEGPLS
jgi:nucleotide-binding universal stress UspA family protein